MGRASASNINDSAPAVAAAKAEECKPHDQVRITL